jgi:YD repeat-containing protein
MSFTAKIFFVSLALAPLASHCGVNPKDGNYYVSYLDVQLPGGQTGLQVMRSYNSVARRVGWLGVGWGTPFETYVALQPDGEALVHENGSGAVTRYRQSPTSAKGALGWQADECPQARLERQGTSFVRTGCDGSQEIFTREGNWLSKRFASGEIHTAEWGDNNRPSRIRDETGNVLAFEWSPQGQATRVSVNSDVGITYTFDSGGRLTSTSGYQVSPAYRFSYTSAGLLAGIHYIDTTSVDLEYTEQGRVTSLTNRLGDRETYRYRDTLPSYPSLVETVVIKSGADGVEQERTRYVYNVTLNRLSRIEHANSLKAYRYDRKGQVTSVVSTGQGRLYLRYDRQDRITRLHLAPEGGVGNTIRFGYTTQGQVNQLTLQGRTPVALLYAPNGELAPLSDPVAMSTVMQIVKLLENIKPLLSLTSARLPL